MKRLYITLFIILCFSITKAQYVTIPDQNFASWLQTNSDLAGCMNGGQLDTTCAAVLNKTTMDLSDLFASGVYMSDFTGLQYFKNLQYLDISNRGARYIPALPASLTYFNCSNNAIDSLPALPSTLLYLDCSYNLGSQYPGFGAGLVKISSFPNSLLDLNCSGLLLDSMPPFPSGLTYLSCADNLFATLPFLPYNLTYLNCGGNSIYQLPTLPLGLDTFICQYNQLTSLPSLPDGITYFDCGNQQGNNLSITALPASLQILFCDDAGISSLPTLPSGLTLISASGNKLTNLPALPPALEYINCSYNKLTSMPALPSMNSLYCSSNKLTSLPALGTLIYLVCDNNLLTSLPALPGNLRELECGNNQLTSLPSLPNLQTLICNDNQLSSLPPIPSSLSYLTCSNNQLTSLPALPPVMGWLNIANNKFISCLPSINKITTTDKTQFSINGTNITCLPNRILHLGIPSLPAIDTLPLCGGNNPSGCTIAWGIQGNVSFDSDNNCSTTVGEPSLGNIKLLLYDNTGTNLLEQVFTNGVGQFSFGAHMGNYIVKADTAGTPFMLLCPDSNIHHSNLTFLDSLDYNANFRLVCKPGYDVGVNSVNYNNGVFFPGENVTLNIQAGDFATHYNTTCNTSGLSGTVQAVITGPVTISSASAGSAIVGNTVTWTVNDFSQTNFATAFILTLTTNTNATGGQPVCINVTVASSSGSDNNPSNNYFSECFNTVASHDPNFKEVYPSNIASAGEWLTYTIHFQNTGNAPAHNINVLDTLDENLDIASLQVIASSHTLNTQLLPNRVARFNFPAIFLPDSLHHADSSVGFVQFKIKTNDNVGSGTTIKNTASVYFDYNTPVQTNTAVSSFDTKVLPKVSLRDKLQVYPNPTNGIVNIIKTAGSPSGDPAGTLMNVTDMLGREVFHNILISKQSTIDMSGFATGVYYIRVSTAKETQTVKVIKE